MNIPETDVGKLLALFKRHDSLIDDLMSLVKGNMELIKNINNVNDNNIQFINRQGDLIVILFDEINRLNERIDKLEKVIEDVQS